MSKTGYTISLSTSGDEPVTLAEVKQQLRLDYDDENTYLDLLIKAARSAAEAHLKTALVAHSLATSYQGAQEAVFTPWRIGEVVSLTYKDAAGNDAAVDAEDYEYYNCDSGGGIVAPADSWSEAMLESKSVKLTYTSAPEGPIPHDIKVAILLVVTDLYENRTNPVRRHTQASERFLNRYRTPTL